MGLENYEEVEGELYKRPKEEGYEGKETVKKENLLNPDELRVLEDRANEMKESFAFKSAKELAKSYTENEKEVFDFLTSEENNGEGPKGFVDALIKISKMKGFEKQSIKDVIEIFNDAHFSRAILSEKYKNVIDGDIDTLKEIIAFLKLGKFINGENSLFYRVTNSLGNFSPENKDQFKNVFVKASEIKIQNGENGVNSFLNGIKSMPERIKKY